MWKKKELDKNVSIWCYIYILPYNTGEKRQEKESYSLIPTNHIEATGDPKAIEDILGRRQSSEAERSMSKRWRRDDKSELPQ